MKVSEVGTGVCFGIGATNYRVGHIDSDGFVGDCSKSPTPDNPDEFFGQAARILLEAADAGATWSVMGVPGPVSVEWDIYDVVSQQLRVTNVAALKTECDPIAEMVQVDPAVGRLINSGEFTFLSVNDGSLAVLAGAKKYGSTNERAYNTIGALFPGTGIGAHIATRDSRFPFAHLFHPATAPWEIGHIPTDFSNPSRTYETNFAGPGLAKLLDVKSAMQIEHDDPIWVDVGHALGAISIQLALNGGAELIVVSGGIGIGEQKGYSDEMRRTLDRFARSRNPMADKVPVVEIVPEVEKDTYEMLGARGAIVSHLTRRAIDHLVQTIGVDVGGTQTSSEKTSLL